MTDEEIYTTEPVEPTPDPGPSFQELWDTPIQVIGMDVADPNNIQVILNDPGIPNGRGIRHSLDEFEAAWNTGNRFTISATKE